jgi:hypothetical protein
VSQEAKYKIEKGADSKTDDWSSLLARHFGSAFYQVAAVAMWEIGLIVYARREHSGRIANVETASKATGIAGIAGNKGAVCVAFSVHERAFCCVSSHLAARADYKRLMNRNENYADIVDELGVGVRKKHGVDVLHQFDYVLWLGDLNYRIDLPRDELFRLVDARPREWHRLAAHDQLRGERAAARAFAGFSEPPMRFRPTYRLERDSDAWSQQTKAKLSVQNAPAWCDRVLLHAAPHSIAETLEYAMVPSLRSSDHRPVFATFVVELPLAPHPFDSSIHAYQILLYDVVVTLRRATDVLRAASGEAPPSPPARLALRAVSRLLQDKPAHIAVAPQLHATLALRAGSDPPCYQPQSTCVSIGPFVALGGWCREGARLNLLVSAVDSTTSAIAQCALSLAAVMERSPTLFSVQLLRGGVPCGRISGAIHVASD